VGCGLRPVMFCLCYRVEDEVFVSFQRAASLLHARSTVEGTNKVLRSLVSGYELDRATAKNIPADVGGRILLEAEVRKLVPGFPAMSSHHPSSRRKSSRFPTAVATKRIGSRASPS